MQRMNDAPPSHEPDVKIFSFVGCLDILYTPSVWPSREAVINSKLINIASECNQHTNKRLRKNPLKFYCIKCTSVFSSFFEGVKQRVGISSRLGNGGEIIRRRNIHSKKITLFKSRGVSLEKSSVARCSARTF